MSSKFIISVVCLTIVQSVIAQESTVYGLSEKQTATFNQLKEGQEAADTARLNAFNPFFNFYDKLATNLVYSEAAATGNPTVIATSSLAEFTKSSVTVISSLLESVEKICSDLMTPINYSTYSAKVFAAYGEVLSLAEDGKYDAQTRAKIENLRLTTEDNVERLLEVIYDFVRNCVDTKDASVTAIMQTSQERNTDNFLRVGNAVFSGAESILNETSAGRRDVALLSIIENDRRNAIQGIEDLSIIEYSLFQSLYLTGQLKISGIAAKLYSIQYAWLASFNRYTTATEAIFDTMQKYLNGVDSVDPDAAEKISTSYYKKGLRILVDSVIEVDPTAETEAESIWEYLVAFTDVAFATYYDAIAMIQTDANSDDVEKKIEEMKAEGLAGIPMLVDSIVSLIRNGKTWDDDVEAKIESIQGSLNKSVENYLADIYDGIIGFANYDNDAIATSSTSAISGLNIFTYQISYLRYVILVAEN